MKMARKQETTGLQPVARLPLVGAFSNRDSTTGYDQRFVNIFPEARKVEQIDNTKLSMHKRAGLSSYRDYGSGAGRGCIFFNDKFYVAVGNTVYEDAVSPVSKITLTGSTGPIGMVLGNSITVGDYLFVCDGTNAWYINTSGTVTQVSTSGLRTITITAGGSGYTNGSYSCGFSGGGGSGAAATYTVTGGVVTSVVITNRGTGYSSAPSVTFPSGGGSGAAATAYLNAFPSPHVPSPVFIDGYILLAKNSDIYNCVLDTPAEWDSSNYITAEMFPDAIVALTRQNNQVVALGSNSIEFFYDAANATGSPLSRNDSSTIQMGCAAPYAVIGTEKYFSYISQSGSGGRGFWIVDGFTPKKVSDDAIERILDSDTDLSTARGFAIRSKGHFFYVLNLKNANRTLVYDTEEKLWHEWSSNNSGSHTIFACDYVTDNESGIPYLLHTSNGVLYKFDPSIYQDDGVAILVDITTNKYDFDTYKRKFMHSFKVVADRYVTGNSISFKWTDDDYQSWSNIKTITLTDDFPAFLRLGSFRRRAFNLTHSLNYPLRIESIEVEYSLGVS
jgi:hypothetical protein